MTRATQTGAEIGRLCMALSLNDGEDQALEWRLLDGIDRAREGLSHMPVETSADRLALLASMREDVEMLDACAAHHPDDAARTARLRRMIDALMQQAITDSGLPETMFGPVVRRQAAPLPHYRYA